MGSLGDKFKKLAGDQTRQLLQNFQNAQSSKTKNGYSYGKLNEDGTATLADGTTVQVEVKGRPGQYAPVFNLGNGQGLVDQPEAKFFTVDGGEVFRYKIVAAQYSQRPPLGSGTIYSNANILETSGIELHDYISGTTNLIRPEIYSELSTLPAPTTSTGPRFTTALGGVLRGVPAFDQVNYTYGGVYMLLGAECKDLLLYQQSSYSDIDILTSYQVDFDPETGDYTLVDAFVRNIDVGSSHYFRYVLLESFYIDDEGYVTSDNIRSGVFTGPSPSEGTSVTNTQSGGFLGGFTPSWVVGKKRSSFIPFLYRDSDGIPTLSIYGVKASSDMQFSGTLTVVTVDPGPPPTYGLQARFTSSTQSSIVGFYTTGIGTDSESTSIIPAETYELSGYTNAYYPLSISGYSTQSGFIGGGYTEVFFQDQNYRRLDPVTILPLGDILANRGASDYYFVGPNSIITEEELLAEIGVSVVFPAYSSNSIGSIGTISIDYAFAPNIFFSNIITPNRNGYWIAAYRPDPSNFRIQGFYRFTRGADGSIRYRQLPTTVDSATYTIPRPPVFASPVSSYRAAIG